jgi:hypothetical protein
MSSLNYAEDLLTRYGSKSPIGSGQTIVAPGSPAGVLRWLPNRVASLVLDDMRTRLQCSTNILNLYQGLSKCIYRRCSPSDNTDISHPYSHSQHTHIITSTFQDPFSFITMASTTHTDFGANTEATEVAQAFADGIRGKTILITGVNRGGIGFATAQAFVSSPLLAKSRFSPVQVHSISGTCNPRWSQSFQGKGEHR